MHDLQAGRRTPLSTSSTSSTTAISTGGRRRAVGLLIAVAAAGYGLDQVTKAWASKSLDEGRPRRLIGSLLKLHLTHNPGAAFSIGTSATWVLSLIALVVIVLCLFVARRLLSRAWAVALGLVLAGALGNLTDRVFREPGGGKGHVVDFLELPHWPIFNVADTCVVTAACLIALLAVRGVGLDGRVDGGSDGPAAPTRRADDRRTTDQPS